MKALARIFPWLLCVFASLVSSTSWADRPGSGSKRTSTLYILFDGLRYDLVTEEGTPNLARLAAAGVRGEMIPVWPTMSAPNHWALATGLLPSHSGVINNEIFDPELQRMVSWRNQTSWPGEPIWATVARQGGLSGLVGRWIGGVNMPPGRQPSFHVPYDDLCQNCGALVLALLDQRPSAQPWNPSGYEKRPRLLGLWAGNVDIANHRDGIGSPKSREALKQVDAMVGEIVDGLAKRGLTDQVNVVVVADHGQDVVPDSRQIEMAPFIDEKDLLVQPPPFGSVGHLWPKPGLEDKVYERLRQAHPHVRVMRPSEIPARLQCCNPKTVPPITLAADPGWAMVYKTERMVGLHGWDNQVREMHSIFLAAGPGIRRGAQINPFSIVDVYPLIAHLSGVEPAKTDGSIESLCPILVDLPADCTAAGRQ